ncbi:MAG: class I SAM-dependent methyltransferase [Rhizobiaceae bacterium]
MNRSEVKTRRAGTAATASRAQLAYPLPAGSAETERLIRQSAFINSFTRSLFAEAGIAPGMRVLDVGSGAGDVALIAADMVGPAGEVVGIDRTGAALAIARARAMTVGFAHLTFREGDLAEIGPEEKFDAVVGRLVLMYMPDPAATLRALARHLRPGGIVAFGEYNITPAAMREPAGLPLSQKLFAWIEGAFRYAGAETRMGDKLFLTFRKADLPFPTLSLMSHMGGGPDWDGYAYAAATVRSLLPLILKAGLASEEEIGIDTLEERLWTELVAANGVIRLPELVNAWARVR